MIHLCNICIATSLECRQGAIAALGGTSVAKRLGSRSLNGDGQMALVKYAALLVSMRRRPMSVF
jgi:hypothetical protein